MESLGANDGQVDLSKLHRALWSIEDQSDGHDDFESRLQKHRDDAEFAQYLIKLWRVSSSPKSQHGAYELALKYKDAPEDDRWGIEARKWLDEHSYARPDKGWLAGPINKMLGPLPNHQYLVIDEELNKGVKRYRALSLVFLATIITLLLAFVHFAPWAAISPFSVVDHTLNNLGVSGWLSAIIVIALFFVLIFTSAQFKYRKSIISKSALETAAAEEELWFRAGSESWSWPQRVGSCVGFGLIHVTNFIYPIASILVLMIAGAMFMFVYLRAFKRLGDTRLATIESARLHATYNRFAFLYMGIAILISGAASRFFS